MEKRKFSKIAAVALAMSMMATAAVGGTSAFAANKTQTLEIVKVDSSDRNTQLSGAEFEVFADTNGNKRYDSGIDQSVGRTTESAPGTYTLDGLPAGTYFFKETKAPDGYKISNEVYAVTLAQTGIGNAAPAQTEGNNSLLSLIGSKFLVADNILTSSGVNQSDSQSIISGLVSQQIAEPETSASMMQNNLNELNGSTVSLPTSRLMTLASVIAALANSVNAAGTGTDTTAISSVLTQGAQSNPDGDVSVKKNVVEVADVREDALIEAESTVDSTSVADTDGAEDYMDGEVYDPDSNNDYDGDEQGTQADAYDDGSTAARSTPNTNVALIAPFVLLAVAVAGYVGYLVYKKKKVKTN